MANGVLRPTRGGGQQQQGGGGGALVIGLLALGAVGFGAYELLKPKTCPAGSTLINGECFPNDTPGGCNCLIGMPAGTLYQDNSNTIGIVDPSGFRRGFTDIRFVEACGYDLDRLVQISGARREAIPFGADISTTGICPPQSTSQSPPVGL